MKYKEKVRTIKLDYKTFRAPPENTTYVQYVSQKKTPEKKPHSTENYKGGGGGNSITVKAMKVVKDLFQNPEKGKSHPIC